jgi:tRNA (cmo5U34)-methyltransferase
MQLNGWLKNFYNMTKDWNFNNDWIVNNFDSHVREQLPWYDFATQTVSCIVKNYLRKEGLVYDIGASTGNISRAISGILDSRNARLVAIEESQEMASKYTGVGDIAVCDAVDYEYQDFSVAICFLSLMFIHPSKRSLLLWKLRSKIEDGGCIIIVDKQIQPNGYIGSVFRRLTMEWKLIGGAIQENIASKELSLSGIQRPLSPKELNYDFVEFFRIGEFAGWIIEK